MKEDVGYPSFIKDDSKLDALYAMVSKSFDGCVCSYIMSQKLNLYSVKIWCFFHNHQLNVSDDFFDNTLALHKMMVQENLGMLDQQVDRDK